MVVYHKQVQLLFAVLLAYCAKQHTVGLDAHHGSRREVSDCNEGLAYQLFRLIVCMNTGKDGAVGAGSVVQSELQKLFGFLYCFACFYLYCAEVRLGEGLEVYVLLEQRLYLYVGEVDLLVRGEEAVVVACGLGFAFCCFRSAAICFGSFLICIQALHRRELFRSCCKEL